MCRVRNPAGWNKKQAVHWGENWGERRGKRTESTPQGGLRGERRQPSRYVFQVPASKHGVQGTGLTLGDEERVGLRLRFGLLCKVTYRKGTGLVT